jgi:secreted trypsin-like serine protease
LTFFVQYREANQTRQCGILPSVHHQYGYEKDRVAFGEYPWQVAIMDSYYNYKCAGGLLSPRHVITSSYCVDQMSEDQIRVRVGEWDLQSDRHYQEVYKNYELSVCKKHPFYYGKIF